MHNKFCIQQPLSDKKIQFSQECFWWWATINATQYTTTQLPQSPGPSSMDRNMWVLCRCRGEIESINCFMISLFLSSDKGRGREGVSTEDCVDIWGQQFMVVHEDRTGRGGGMCYAPCLVHTRVTVISDHSRLTWSPRSAGKLPPEPGQ